MTGNDSITENSRRIARNTVLLYFRMLLLMLVGLFTTRVIVGTLGKADFGIYGAVAGVVAMFGIFTNSMSSAISRFITFEMGRSDADLGKIFSTALCIQILLAAAIAVIAEPAGLWWISQKMVLPPDRLHAARWVFHFSVINFAIQLISVPYNAEIIAHERMDAFAWISILEAVCKLAVAFAIMASPVDRLIFYAALLTLVSLITRGAYGFFCHRHFPESRAGVHLDKSTFGHMFAFAGWNTIGAGAGILRDQGGNQLLNLFFGPVANASWSLAAQVNGTVQKFVTSFTTAINPQITKACANGDTDYMTRLIFRGSRMSVWLLMLIVYPILFNAGFLTGLWLGSSLVPDGAVSFIRLVLIYLMVESVSYTMVTAMLSTGNIRDYQLVVGGLLLLNLPADYILLKAGAPAQVIYYVAIAIGVICLFARLIMLHRMIGLPVGRFIREVLLREICVATLALAVPLVLSRVLPAGWPGLIVSFLATDAVAAALIWWLGLDSDERHIITHKLMRR